MNDNKYGRLYPERAVASLRSMMASALKDEQLTFSAPFRRACEDALTALDRLGFPPDEPLFLLRGQDALAGEFVHAYAQMVRDHPQPSVRALDADRIDELADRMDLWTPRKYPD